MDSRLVIGPLVSADGQAGLSWRRYRSPIYRKLRRDGFVEHLFDAFVRVGEVLLIARSEG